MTRIAFISDIHANIDALDSALAHADKVGVDAIICLGDIVGYGPAPEQCIARIREREIPCVIGNHDEYVTLIGDPRLQALKPDIRQVIEWTQARLSMDDLKWLGALHRSIDAEDFGVIHSSFFGKNRWAYCIDEPSFKSNFEYQPYQLAFCGHSHRPLIGFDRSPEEPIVDFIHEQVLPAEGRIMVNVGSVGQPRDHNWRSCVVFYEMESRKLWMDRVEYDLESAIRRFQNENLPERFGIRIMHGK